MTSNDGIKVLVVDDNASFTEVCANWLKDTYKVDKAYEGKEALEKMDEDVDVVLLDRRMPEMSGKEVLEEIKESNYDAKVAMITAVDPDFDIIEMGFDDYLVKPVAKDDVLKTVDHLLKRNEYSDQIQDYFSMASKIAVLESEKRQSELEDNEEYNRLKDEMDELKDELDDMLLELTDYSDFDATFRSISRTPETNGGSGIINK